MFIVRKVFTKEWFTAVAIRMARTFAQVFVGFLGGTQVASLACIDWLQAFSASILAAILCALTALTGLPEVEVLTPYSGQWLLAAFIRALKTAAEAFVSVAGTAAVLAEVNWLAAASAALIGAITSILMSVVSLPEASVPDI